MWLPDEAVLEEYGLVSNSRFSMPWQLPDPENTEVLMYLPARQAVHPDIEAVPVLLVVWPEGHCRQDREAFAGWYFPIEHDSHC